MTPGWLERIGKRLLLFWPLKAVGTPLFMLLFFWVYFLILNNPRTVPTVMPVIWLDHWVGFVPSAFPIYASLWFYVSLPPALMGKCEADDQATKDIERHML